MIDFISGNGYKEIWHERTSVSNDRHKQTPLRGPAPQNPTAPRVIRVPNSNYESSASTQP